MTRDYNMNLDMICRNCNCRRGSHCATGYYSEFYNMYIPLGYCPGNEGRMDWDNGPGTVFEPIRVFESDFFEDE